MRVVVLGATGTVGQHVFASLRTRGIDVVPAARDPSAAEQMLGCTEARQLDMQTGAGMDTVFEGAHAAFVMVPLIENQNDIAHALLTAAVDAGVNHVVRLSSRAATWDDVSALRQWHRYADDLVQEHAPRWTILRPCSFFQNFIVHQRTTIQRMSAIAVPQGFGLIPYIDAKDIGEAAATCFASPDAHHGAVYTLTGSRAYGIKGVAAELSRVLGRPITYIDMDPAQAEASMRQSAMPEWLVQSATRIFERARTGGEAEVDPTLATLINAPPTTLSEFLETNGDRFL